jgi:hypothetical protein
VGVLVMPAIVPRATDGDGVMSTGRTVHRVVGWPHVHFRET